MGPRAFGHPVRVAALASPIRSVSWGSLRHQYSRAYVLMDPRAQSLARCVAACLH